MALGEALVKEMCWKVNLIQTVFRGIYDKNMIFHAQTARLVFVNLLSRI